MTLETVPLQPFGVELRRDLRTPLMPDERKAFRELVLKEGLVLARGQDLSMDQQADLLSSLGPLLNKGSGRGYVAPDDGVLGAQAIDFHSDISFTPEPFEFISLFAVEMSEGAGWTRFASGARAFARLPAETRAWLERQYVTTQYSMNGGSVPFRREAVVRWPGRPDPVLYLSRFAAPRFEGLSKEENAQRLAEIWDHVYAPEHVYHHDWRLGDLVVWDNLALQHARPEIPPGIPRRLQRVVVARKSMLDQVPAELAGVTYEGEAARSAY